MKITEKLKVDLRSDTVTLPTSKMFSAIAEAKLGDDVMEEDPTVKELEKQASSICGQEDGLLLPSGTAANLVAILSHTKPADAVLLEEQSHIMYYEVGGIARIAGVMPYTFKSERGHPTSEQIRENFKSGDLHTPPTVLLCLENTHNRAGGTVLGVEETQKLCDTAHSLGMKVHLDGARIFNAAQYLRCEVKDLTKYSDSVMFCLSKGLGAPIGSVLCGGRAFIQIARRMRKLIGGGMRQAGIIAAAGLVALQEGPEQLIEDHKKAQFLAKQLVELPGISLDLDRVQTNIIIFTIKYPADWFVEALAKEGVLTFSFGQNKIRMVTHKDVSFESLPYVIEKVKKVLNKGKLVF